MSKDILAQPATEDDGSAAILAIVNPPTGCLPCYAERGETFPPTHSTRTCERHGGMCFLDALSNEICQHRDNPAPLFGDDELNGWILDSLLAICDTGAEVVFRLKQFALARQETVAYSHGL